MSASTHVDCENNPEPSYCPYCGKPYTENDTEAFTFTIGVINAYGG